MAKRIKIIPVLDTKTLFKQLKQLGNRKQKINIGVNGSGINNTVQQLHQMNSAGNTSTSIFGKLKNVIKDTFSEGKIVTTAYLAVLNMVYKAGAKAKEAIEDIDESITNISVATNLSRKATADLVGEYNQYARELKATTKDVTDAADDWLRAGKTMEEAKELIKDSTMLSKLGQIAPTEATEDLLATMNGYELSVQQTGEALDAMVAIDMRAATSAGDLATGLKYSASSAYSAGVSLNKLLGILGAVQDKTQQTSQVVGTFANTLLSRYRDITIGKYLTEDGEDISNYEATLKSIGISLRDSQGEFRSFETVLGEMANKWDTLSSVQQNALIKIAAGTRQNNRFIALMEGYNRVLELTEVAANSAGTAIEKYNNSYADSLEAKQNELQASFEALIMNNDFSKVYGDIIDATTALVDFINKTNALKGVATSLAVAGFIKGFLSIRTGINEAYISLNQFHSALDLVQKKNLSTKEFDRLLLLTNKLSESQTRVILSSKNLSIRQKEQILVAQGLSKEEAKLKLQTLGLTNAQTGLTASTVSLKNAAKGLLAYIAANPLTVLLTAISTASMVFSSYKNHLEELRQTAQDGANAYKESASSIDDYVAKYQDLHRALLEAKGDEQATYDIKKQLLDLQNELNEKFGTETSKINLVSDAYRDQTEILKSYNKELANKYLNENREGIQTATKQMTKTREYILSDNGISLDTASGKAINDIVQKYSDKGMSLLDSGAGTYQVIIKADAENAYEAINDFSNDLRERAKELGNEHLFDGILNISSKALNDAKSVVEDYSNIYKQALMAELVSDDVMSAVYNEALNAVEQYNQAVASSPNPYNDENVSNAKKNLDEVRAKIDGNLAEWGKYSSITNDLFEQAETKLLDFNENLKSNSRLIVDALSLKALNFSDLDLKSFNPGENEAFDRLKESAEEYGLSVEQLIDALVRLGYVQGGVSSKSEDTFSVKTVSLKDLNDQIDSIQSAYKALISASEEYNKYGYVTADTLQTLLSLDSQYLACLIDENGQLALNGTAYQNLIQAKLADAEATAVQQAIEELGKVTTEQQIEADKTAIGIIAEKSNVLASLTGQYGALADVAVSAAQAQALADGYTQASNKNKAEADKIMSNLNAKLALIQSTAKSTAGSFGAMTNHLNGFSNASSKAKDKTDALTESMEKQKKALEATKSELEKQKQYYEDVISAVNWFYDKNIKKQEKYIKNLEKQNELIQKQIDLRDAALSAIDRYYEKQQQALQDKIDAMDKANTLAEKELAIEKAKDAYLEARSRKSILQYSKNTGFSYTVDQKAIKEAEDNLANATQEKLKYDLQQEIQKLQEYRDLWAEIPKIKEQAEQDSQMISQLGAEWESILLEGRIENITAFKDKYVSLQQQIDDNTSMIESYQQKVEYYENLKSQWEELTSKYEEETYTQLLISAFGNDFEDILLSGRTERWQQFAEDYYNTQVELKNVTDKIEALAKRMEEYASRIESAANRAADAVRKIESVGNVVEHYGKPTGSYGASSNSISKPNYSASVKAKGGIITKKDKGDLDFIAKDLGEDHMIGIQEGEAVIPKESVKQNPEVVNTLINGEQPTYRKLEYFQFGDRKVYLDDFKNNMLGTLLKGITPATCNVPKYDYSNIVNNNHNNATTVSIGEIHLHEVQNADRLSKEIINKFPMKMTQALSNRNLYG